MTCPSLRVILSSMKVGTVVYWEHDGVFGVVTETKGDTFSIKWDDHHEAIDGYSSEQSIKIPTKLEIVLK